MAKVIVERPRRGGGMRYPRHQNPEGGRIGQEDWRKTQGIRRPWLKGDFKGLNENLAPLHRFLRSNVGRPWNKVYSEVCQRINRNSAVQFHVWQHLIQDVCTDPYVIDGSVGRGRWRTWFLYYVEPKTGLLRENKRRWKRSGSVVTGDQAQVIRIDSSHECRQLDGIWYELNLEPLPMNGTVFDMVLKRRWPLLGTSAFHDFYGKDVYCVQKRQLNKKEIRRLLSEKTP
jgi:hypothetical protein